MKSEAECAKFHEEQRNISYTKTQVLFCTKFNKNKFAPKLLRTLLVNNSGEAATRGVLRNFTKFTGKHLCQSFFFNKVAGLRPATLLKKRLWHRCFPVNFAKFPRTSFHTEHLQWLLLKKENNSTKNFNHCTIKFT